MKRSDMDDDSEWGINGKDLGNGQILKWPVVLSTSEYDVYQVEDHYVAFSCYASYGSIIVI